MRENVKGLVGFYRLVGKTGKTRLPLTDSLLFFLGSVLLSFCNFKNDHGQKDRNFYFLKDKGI